MFRLIKSGILTIVYLLNCTPVNRSFMELSRPERERLIDAWIISERDREIMRRRFCDHVTVEVLAEDYEMSVRGVNYLLKRGIKTIENNM